MLYISSSAAAQTRHRARRSPSGRSICDWSIVETVFLGWSPGAERSRIIWFLLGGGATNSTEKSIVEVRRSELYVIGRLQELFFGVVPRGGALANFRFLLGGGATNSTGKVTKINENGAESEQNDGNIT